MMHKGIGLECNPVAAHEILHPKVPELGTSKVPFTKMIYIEWEDFKLEDSKDYFRLQCSWKNCRLFEAPLPIACTSYRTDPATGSVVEVIAKLENTGNAKEPEAFTQWVAKYAPSRSPIQVDEARIFHELFKSDNPAASPDYLVDTNSDSLEVVKGATSRWTNTRSPGSRRKATTLLLCSGKETIVLNRIVGLKEDSGKATWIRCMTFINVCNGTSVKKRHARKRQRLTRNKEEDT